MIRDEIKEQQEKLKDKSLQEKLKYFFDYYKFHVLIGIAGIAFVIYAFTIIINNNYEPSIYVAFLNNSLTSMEETTLLSDYAKSRSIDMEKTPAMVDTSIMIDEQITSDLTLASFQKLMALLSSGELDIVVCDSWFVDEYAPLSTYENLKEILPNDLYEKVKANLYYAKNEEGLEIPVAFYINDIEKIMQQNLYPDDAKPLLTIPASSERKEAAIDFIRYLYE